MGPVVCCVDDSENARAALAVGRRLAESLGRGLLLLHVAPPIAAPGLSAAPAGHARLLQEELDDANALLGRIVTEEGLGGDVVVRAMVGSAAAAIVEVCTEENASFVVLGSRGRGEIASAVLGSVSKAVASSAPCPVVIVPPAAAASEAQYDTP